MSVGGNKQRKDVIDLYSRLDFERCGSSFFVSAENAIECGNISKGKGNLLTRDRSDSSKSKCLGFRTYLCLFK